MNPEIAAHSKYIRQRIAQIHEALAGLSEEELNRAPYAGGNSCFVIATHTFGNVRAWVIGIACGQDMGRDRPSEFASRGTYADLTAAANKLSADVEAALADLDPATLDDVFTPKQELFGEGRTHEMTRRETLLHPLEHASIHLGHIHVTLDLLRDGR